MSKQTEDSDSGSGVLKQYRIVERLDWIPVLDHHSEPMDSAKESVGQWRGYLEAFGHRVLWTRCMAEEQRVDSEGAVWVKAWLIAGIEKKDTET